MEVSKVAEAYIGAWNEVNDAQRADVLRSGWTSDASYVDPLMRGSGAAQISSLIGAVHQRFPGFRFKLKGVPSGYEQYVRLSWSFGPEGAEAPVEGSDFIELREGKIRSVVGFIDKTPNAG